MKITKKDVLEIAVAYQAYCAADTDNGIAVWGRYLAERQRKTGVELVPAAMLAARVEAVQARYNAATKAARDAATAEMWADMTGENLPNENGEAQEAENDRHAPRD